MERLSRKLSLLSEWRCMELKLTEVVIFGFLHGGGVWVRGASSDDSEGSARVVCNFCKLASDVR